MGYAGRAACSASTASKAKFDIESKSERFSFSRLTADGFEISQVGTLQTNRQCSPSVGYVPTKLTITTDKRLVIGQSLSGRAMVQVGDKVFDSAGLYFKFQVYSLDVENRTVAGEFEFMSQDQDNRENRDTLFAKGAFAAKL